MGFLDDIRRAAGRFDAWAERTGRALREWAGSDDGQLVLAGLDYLSLSSRIAEFYEHTGWYFPVHPTFHRYALEHQELHMPFDARAAARRVGPGSLHWKWIVDGTLASPSLAARIPVVRDGTFCIEQRRWHAAVSTLLPVIEGVVADHSTQLKKKGVGERVHHLLHHGTGPYETLSAVPAVAVLKGEIFGHVEFDKITIAHDAPNRHVVLHGRAAGFGTEANAIRTFMLLVAVVELLDGAILFRAHDPPIDDISFLDEYGPLAELRIAARRFRS